MKCTDPKRAGELGMQHAGLLAQMAAIVDNAQHAGRELRGDELLQHDRLTGQAARVLAELQTIDPLGAKAAGGNAPSRPITPAPPSSANPIMRRVRDGVVYDRGRGPTPVSGLNRLTHNLESAVRFDRGSNHASDVVIRGYGTLFNTLFHAKDGSRALLLPGSFDLSSTILCINHDISRSYASMRDGSLRCWQDGKGIAIEAMVGETAAGRDLIRAISSGTKRGLSAMFEGVTSSMETIRGERVRAIASARIPEVSVVSEPLCPGASCWLERIAA